MKKSFLILSVAVAAVLSLTAFAQQPGRYVRKQLKPAFFIPEKELNRSEKLPEFHYYPQNKKAIRPVEKDIEPEILEISDEVDLTSELPQETADTTALPAVDNTKPLKIESEYITYNKEELAAMPEYKQKYDDYINDLKVIAETGKAPENKRLNDDLAKMNSNDRIIVDANFGLQSIVEDTNPVPKDIPPQDVVEPTESSAILSEVAP